MTRQGFSISLCPNRLGYCYKGKLMAPFTVEGACNRSVFEIWLIDSITKQVEIYRPGQEAEVLESPTSLSGKDVLPGFILNLSKVW